MNRPALKLLAVVIAAGAYIEILVWLRYKGKYSKIATILAMSIGLSVIFTWWYGTIEIFLFWIFLSLPASFIGVTVAESSFWSANRKERRVGSSQKRKSNGENAS